MWDGTCLACFRSTFAACAQASLSWQQKSCFQAHHSLPPGVGDWIHSPNFAADFVPLLWNVAPGVQRKCDNFYCAHSAAETFGHSIVEFMAARSWTAVGDGGGLTCKLFAPRGWMNQFVIWDLKFQCEIDISAALTSRGEDVNPKRLFQEAWASSVEFDWWCLEKSASVRCGPLEAWKSCNAELGADGHEASTVVIPTFQFSLKTKQLRCIT